MDSLFDQNASEGKTYNVNTVTNNNAKNYEDALPYHANYLTLYYVNLFAKWIMGGHYIIIRLLHNDLCEMISYQTSSII